MAAAMFMNSNALPIALMQSLVVSVPDLAWGSDDNKNAMLGRALTYLTMYSTLGMVVSQFVLSCGVCTDNPIVALFVWRISALPCRHHPRPRRAHTSPL